MTVVTDDGAGPQSAAERGGPEAGARVQEARLRLRMAPLPGQSAGRRSEGQPCSLSCRCHPPLCLWLLSVLLHALVSETV